MSSETGNWWRSILRRLWYSQVIDVLMVLLFLAMLLISFLLLTVPSLEVGQVFVNIASGTM